MEYSMIACFFSIDETEFDTLESILQTYDIGQYVIAHESEPKSHFHLLFEGTDNIYSNFSKRIVEKYKLRRQGRGGIIKYGKVKEIRNLERMLTYTLKDGNFRSNMDPIKLQAYFEKSFKKSLKDLKLHNIVEHLDSLIQHRSPNNHILTYSDAHEWVEQATLMIVEYWVDQEVSFTKSEPSNYCFKFIQQSNILNKESKKKLLKSYLL